MTGMMKSMSGESIGGMFGGTPIYEPLDVGAAMTAGASWGTAVDETMQTDSKGTAGKTIASNGLPLGVPSSSTGGLSAPQVRSTPQLSSPPLLTSSPHLTSHTHLLPPPTSSQSAEVAAAAAASVSLQVSVRKAAVAVVKASSGVTFKFEAAGERSELNMEDLKAGLAAKLGVNASDITLDAKDPSPAPADAAADDAATADADDDDDDASADRRRRSRRRMSAGGSVSLKAYVATTDKDTMLTSMKAVASDVAALSAALNISVLGTTTPELLQVMLSSSPLLLSSSHLSSSPPPLLVSSSHLSSSPPPLLSPRR